MDLYEIIRCVRRRFLVFAIVAVAVIAAGAALRVDSEADV